MDGLVGDGLVGDGLVVDGFVEDESVVMSDDTVVTTWWAEPTEVEEATVGEDAVLELGGLLDPEIG